jgi:hypothetical protein
MLSSYYGLNNYFQRQVILRNHVSESVLINSEDDKITSVNSTQQSVNEMK